MLVGILVSALAAWGLEPTTPLQNLNRQGWVMENGLPQNTVQALAQTADGFLWLGTEVGLVRFDGVAFQVFDEHSKPALPSGDVRCLLAAKDGALWVGTSDGLARVRDGAVTVFRMADGLPGNDIRAIVQAGNGELWVNSDQGLAFFRDGRFVPGNEGLGDSKVAAIASGEGDVPWVATQRGLFVEENGKWNGPLFPGLLKGNITRLLFADHGSARLVADNSSVHALIREGEAAHFTVGRELPGTRVQTMFIDSAGSLWIGTNGGLVRYAEGKLEKLAVTDPLASASVLSILEDREGNLWVGTEQNGLQILRDQRFETLTTRDGLASDVILSLAATPVGDLWVGTPDGLSRIRRGAVATFTSADGLPDDFIRSLLADGDGSLWIATRRGLTHWTKPGDVKAAMQTYTEADGLGSDLVGAMARDGASGDLWVATFAGLSRLHAGKLENFTTANGLSSNVITAILPRGGGSLLIGTQDHGWNAWDGARFTAITENGLGRTTVHAILDDGRGHLWFATGGGIARCDCATHGKGDMGPMQAADCSHWMEFSTADGLRSRETAVNSHPSAWRSTDGRLWFATPKGPVAVDPAHFPVNTLAPPVVVERFAVDDAEQALGSAGRGAPLEIPAGHNHIQFEYAALSFVAPQRVRYRYMLEGFDHNWTDAGSRRTAYYTNIPPGHYTFRVQAANNDGVWNMQGAAFAFEQLPHFYQTVWFYVLLALAVIGLILLALRLRLLRAEREFRAVLGERGRIAREIHDTLAQGYVGISVQLEVLSELLRQKKMDAAAKQLDATRGQVREGLAEARQSIWALRSQDSAETTLPVRMRRLAEQAGGHGLHAQFNLYGAYRPLPAVVENEILRVAQEALHNVKKHAGAKHVKVQLEYISSEIALEVRDDGRGFRVEGDGAQHDSPAGHYGLTGMRERAAAIGGSLEVTSEPGAGTTVRLRSPIPKGSARDAAGAREMGGTRATAAPQDVPVSNEVKE